MTPYLDVIFGQNRTNQTVLEGRESGDEFMSCIFREFPDTDLTVLMACKYKFVEESNRLDGATRIGGVVECVEKRESSGIEDIDRVSRGSIEKVVVQGEEVDVGECERGLFNGDVGDREIKRLRGDLLEGGNRGECLEGEVSFEGEAVSSVH